MGSDDQLLFTGIAMAAVVALGCDWIARRRPRRWLVTMGVVVMAMAIVYASIGWSGDRPGAHSANPAVSRIGDWFGHVVIVGLVFALPVLTGLGVATLLSRRSVTRAKRFSSSGEPYSAPCWPGL